MGSLIYEGRDGDGECPWSRGACLQQACFSSALACIMRCLAKSEYAREVERKKVKAEKGALFSMLENAATMLVVEGFQQEFICKDCVKFARQCEKYDCRRENHHVISTSQGGHVTQIQDERIGTNPLGRRLHHQMIRLSNRRQMFSRGKMGNQLRFNRIIARLQLVRN